MKKLLFLVFGLFIFYGCASTGVVPIGPDTYMISRQGGGAWTSTGKLKAEIIREGNEYCLSIQKKFMPVSTQTIPSEFGRLPEAEMQFMCLTEGDYELRRPKPGLTPGTENKTTIDLNIHTK